MTRSSTVALVLAALLLGGCSLVSSANNAPPKTLSHFQFARRANHMCALGNRRVKGLRKPVNVAMYVRETNAVIRSQERIIVGFRGLTPPPSDAGSFSRLIADADAYDVVTHRLVDAAGAHDVRQGKSLARRITVINKRLRRRARSLGLRSCVKGLTAVRPAAPAARPGNTNSSGHGMEFTLNGHTYRIVTVDGKTTIVQVR